MIFYDRQMGLDHFGNKVIQSAAVVLEEITTRRKYKKISAKYDLNGYKRMYLVHIRKTGGTSLNNMFLALSGEDPKNLYDQLALARNHRLISNGLIYVGWNLRLINRGEYYYAFSHTPFHKLDLPEKTFTICAEFMKNTMHKACMAAGCEYRYHNKFTFRAGIKSFPYVLTFGAGLKLGQLTLDIASGLHTYLGFSPSISFTYSSKQ